MNLFCSGESSNLDLQTKSPGTMLSPARLQFFLSSNSKTHIILEDHNSTYINRIYRHDQRQNFIENVWIPLKCNSGNKESELNNKGEVSLCSETVTKYIE